ncbi:helix-turn-helix domain-containing protein [Microbacterium allomyrinae]|uniref:Helix-turn-helix transcriptional regulator n=1 Tax=Microbacterium allomyrinae TaxID=2830666 RepID=A0A9X1LWE5_9MICO|nr:helix-turn-helix transcriptional regulator [Microbacterium allomyrinae]MCC2033107.1 helix-turn-helix transcriptional regulator [Microbacterium allomyrinae]
MPKKRKAPETFDEHVGAAVDAQREKRRMTQDELAVKTGVRLTSLGRRLAGKIPFTVGEIEIIASVLTVKAHTIVEAALEDYGGIEKLLATAVSEDASNVTPDDNVTYLGHVTPPYSAAADEKPRVDPKD